MRAAVLATLAACGGGKEPPAPEPGAGSGSAAPAPMPEPPQDLSDLTVTHAGKKIAMKRAFLVRRSADHYRLVLSDSQGSCKETREGVITHLADATTISIGFSKVLRPDGTFQVQTYDYLTPIGRAPKPYVDLEVVPYRDDAVEVEVRIPRMELTKEGAAGSFVTEGIFKAKNCGVDGIAPARLKAPHVSAATLTVAGVKRDIKGVTLHGTEIALSTEPIDCSRSETSAELELRFDNGAFRLGGSWINPLASITTFAETLPGTTFKVGAMGDSPDGKVATVELAGTSKIGPYTIALAGKAEALDCPVD